MRAADVLEIRRAYAAGGLTQAALAARYGLSVGAICALVAGQTWRDVGGPTRPPAPRRPRTTRCPVCGRLFRMAPSRYALRTRRTATPRCSRACWRATLVPAHARFDARVNRNEPTGCHLWMGRRDRRGYGSFWIDGRNVRAHRYAYERAHGPIPTGYEVRHLVCDNPPCVNPAHLAVGTAKDNSGDRIARRRQAPQGPPPMRSAAHARSKVTEEMVRTMRALYDADTATQAALGERFGLNRTSVGDIVRRRTWRHVD